MRVLGRRPPGAPEGRHPGIILGSIEALHHDALRAAHPNQVAVAGAKVQRDVTSCRLGVLGAHEAAPGPVVPP